MSTTTGELQPERNRGGLVKSGGLMGVVINRRAMLGHVQIRRVVYGVSTGPNTTLGR
jgi:hypothetical protein